jgi:ubiquinone/menaquinone biosynthesis C-methylase UbiE
MYWIMARETRAENLAAVERLAINPGHRVLEIGFGHGRTLQTLLDRTPLGRVTGVDWSAEMVARAKIRFTRAIAQCRLGALQGTAERLPLPDESFDRILTVHTVYFWSDPAAVLREMRRVVKPGGRMVVAFDEPDPEDTATRFPAPMYTFRKASDLHRTALEAGWKTVTYDAERQRKRTMIWLTATA